MHTERLAERAWRLPVSGRQHVSIFGGLVGRDLHRGRSRGGADFSDVGGHGAESTEPLVCHFPYTNRRYLHRCTGPHRKPAHLVQLRCSLIKAR